MVQNDVEVPYNRNYVVGVATHHSECRSGRDSCRLRPGEGVPGQLLKGRDAPDSAVVLQVGEGPGGQKAARESRVTNGNIFRNLRIQIQILHTHHTSTTLLLMLAFPCVLGQIRRPNVVPLLAEVGTWSCGCHR